MDHGSQVVAAYAKKLMNICQLDSRGQSARALELFERFMSDPEQPDLSHFRSQLVSRCNTLASTEYRANVIECLKRSGISWREDSSDLDFFFFRIRFGKNGSILLVTGKKKDDISCHIPDKLAARIVSEYERCQKTTIDFEEFGKELIWAYEIALNLDSALTGSGGHVSVALDQIYSLLHPKKEQRVQTSKHDFSILLSKFRESGFRFFPLHEFEFAPSRESKRNWILRHSSGREDQVSSLRVSKIVN